MLSQSLFCHIPLTKAHLGPACQMFTVYLRQVYITRDSKFIASGSSPSFPALQLWHTVTLICLGYYQEYNYCLENVSFLMLLCPRDNPVAAFRHVPLGIPAPLDEQQSQKLSLHRFQAGSGSVSPKRLQGSFRLVINTTKTNIWNTVKLLPVVLASGNALAEERPFPQARFLCRQLGIQWSHSFSSQAPKDHTTRKDLVSCEARERQNKDLTAAPCQSESWGEAGHFLNTILSKRVDAAVQLCWNHHWVTQGL